MAGRKERNINLVFLWGLYSWSEFDEEFGVLHFAIYFQHPYSPLWEVPVFKKKKEIL
jgi:hypothetical protein